MTDIPSGFTRLESTSPFHELVGPFYEKRDRATLIIGMPVAKKHINRRGAVHGGMICTLVDFAMGQAASTMTNPPRKVVTTTVHGLCRQRHGRRLDRGARRCLALGTAGRIRQLLRLSSQRAHRPRQRRVSGSDG
jgi:acyl-coenzyme A thioesterase PaaI-like protein